MEHPRVGRQGQELERQVHKYGPVLQRQDLAERAGRVRTKSVKPIRPSDGTAARPLSPFMINACCQAAFFSSSSLYSSSRETFFSLTLASSRMKSTTLSSKIGARSWASALALLR